VDLACYRNALTIYGKSGQMSEDWLDPASVDTSKVFQGNSIQRGGTLGDPRVVPGSSKLIQN
jgi:hypothetical protein